MQVFVSAPLNGVLRKASIRPGANHPALDAPPGVAMLSNNVPAACGAVHDGHPAGGFDGADLAVRTEMRLGTFIGDNAV
jgi:hypothetical protein